LCFLISASGFGRDKNLEITFVDVEGGQATLIVSPSGESLLIDTGWPGFGGRDADRIVAAARAAGLMRINYVLITHYHEDHVGGVPQLAQRIPIGTFIDHGPSVETDSKTASLVSAYNGAVAKARHLVVKPGDKIPIRGIDIDVVTAGGEAIRSPLAGAGQANPLCSDPTPRLEDTGENARSIGVLIRYGKFHMIDLGDLTWDKERELACPRNLVGHISLYLSTAHAHPGFGQAVMVHALAPRVAIMNNGSRKGGDPAAWQIVHSAPGLEDLWQLHYATESPVNLNAPSDWVANPEEECEAESLKLAAKKDGSFTVLNLRNGFSKRYNSQ
jgi:beta-lactamase superfamily II metal-dependent hydrolase